VNDNPTPFGSGPRIIPRTNFFIEFQFVWYEIVSSPEFELAGHSGGLYRDIREQNLQQQSFLVSRRIVGLSPSAASVLRNQVNAFWNFSPLFGAQSDEWTIILMVPALFDVALLESYMDLPDTIVSTLISILFAILSKILTSWAAISDYIEIFVASKFTFLNEEEHDFLLFDDNIFSRSRQYFWVITSTGEFISIIRKTLKHYQEVKN
jgi:hypothetical protein